MAGEKALILDNVAIAKARLEELRLDKTDAKSISEQSLEGMHVVLTDAEAVVEAVDSLFEKKSIIGKKCSELQNRDDPRNDEGNSAIRFYMYVRQPVVTHLINLTPSGHEFINVISIVPKFYTNYHDETKLVGFYSFQFPLYEVTIEKFRPPPPPTVKELFCPEKGELVWFRVDQVFKRGHVIETLFRTYIVREVKSKYDYCGVEDVWPIDYVESLRDKKVETHWRRRSPKKPTIAYLKSIQL